MDNWKVFLQEEDEIDDQIFKQYLWTTNDFPAGMIRQQSVVLVIQPPWIVSVKDLHEFSHCRTVSSTRACS
jgi:hypothetical protein